MEQLIATDMDKRLKQKTEAEEDVPALGALDGRNHPRCSLAHAFAEHITEQPQYLHRTGLYKSLFCGIPNER